MITPVNVYEHSRAYYEKKLEESGCSPAGVDWKDEKSQHMRFHQLLKILPKSLQKFTIADVGCGYGELYYLIKKITSNFKYYGIDISDKMVEMAKVHCKGTENAAFFSSNKIEFPVDYSIASGIFNTKGTLDKEEWFEYILDTIINMNQYSSLGFSFNCLTAYSDEDRKRTDLYYTDPLQIFDFCKKNFSKQVALLHDYPLYEFTILVRKSLD